MRNRDESGWSKQPRRRLRQIFDRGELVPRADIIVGSYSGHRVSSAARRREAAIWIFTESGFVSVVRHRDHRHLLLVRARDRDSLVSFCRRVRLAESEIAELEKADYRFRVICSDAVLLRFLQGSVKEIDYANFKSKVSTTRGAIWHDTLMRVWAAMRALQPGPSGK